MQLLPPADQAGAPGRARLAPGLRVVRRGRGHLQVGLYDGRRALLPRTPAVERILTGLLGRGAPEGPTDPETVAVLERLERAGCLAAGAPDRVRGTVAVLGRFDGPGLPDVSALLRAGGAVPGHGRGLAEPADVVLRLSVGELAREELDDLVRRQTSHLVVRLVDGGALLGPFVVPGVTACLRCIDAHHALHDPDHVAVTTRYVRATARPRTDGVPDTDPALAALAVAWAVRDVLTYLDDHEPSTWSRTIHLGAQPAASVTEQAWLRHPQCGCTWPNALGPVRDIQEVSPDVHRVDG